MFQDTQPAALDGDGLDRFAEFRVSHPVERLALLRRLRDGTVTVHLNAPGGVALASTLWSVDNDRLAFAADRDGADLERLLQANEGVAVAYLDSVKVQFDLFGLTLVRGASFRTLQAAMPPVLYRFQRRQSFRVRPAGRHVPTARLRHPAIPDMTLELRVLDLSIGGCALALPREVPPLEAGTRIQGVEIELDPGTRIVVALQLQHVNAMGGTAGGGHRLGCQWQLGGDAERTLQRWIDQTQKRSRLLAITP